MMTMRCRFKSRGITLIDLLMTVAILAILMAVSMVSYNGYVNKNKIFNLTRQLVEALNVTKQLAIVRGQQHYFNVQINSSVITRHESCWVISHIESCDCLTSSALCQSKYGQVSAAISDIALTINRPRLSFSSVFGSTNGATYRLSLGRYAIKVIVSTQGRIRVCMERGDSTIYASC